MSEWKTITLGEKAKEITVGFVGPMATEYVENGIPFLRSQNVIPFSIDYNGIKYISEEFHKKLKKSALTPGDVVIVRTGKPGASAVIPKSLPVVNCSDLVIVRCGDKLDPNFISYYINSITKSHVDVNLVGAVQQHFNVGAAKQILIPDIDIIHQCTIASVLSSLDDKIDLLHRQNATLEAMAETLFRQWFVEEAKEDWEEGTLGEVIEIFDNMRVPLSRMERDKKKDGQLYPYYGAAQIMDYINDYIFEGEYILLGEDGTVRTIEGFPVLQYATGKFWVNNHTHVIQAKSPYNNFFVWNYLRKMNIDEIITGAVQPKINQGNLRSLAFPKFPKKLVLEFNELSESFFKKINQNKTQILTLTAIRDTLLPKLMSGEVRVEM